MFVLTVGFERNCDFVEFIVRKKISEISGISELCRGRRSRIEIYSETDIRDIMAKLMAEYVLGPYRDNIALGQIADGCPYLSEDEKKQILNSLPYEQYADGITRKFLEYITVNDSIDIPGFVRFRMPEFTRNAIADTDRACENFMKMREFEEMVSLLKYHIMHSVSSGTSNIIFRPGGEYAVINSDGEYMDVTDFPYFNEIPKHDLILGMLLKVIPERVVVHNSGFADDSIISVLQAVFGDNVSLCDGCGMD